MPSIGRIRSPKIYLAASCVPDGAPPERLLVDSEAGKAFVLSPAALLASRRTSLRRHALGVARARGLKVAERWLKQRGEKIIRPALISRALKAHRPEARRAPRRSAGTQQTRSTSRASPDDDGPPPDGRDPPPPAGYDEDVVRWLTFLGELLSGRGRNAANAEARRPATSGSYRSPTSCERCWSPPFVISGQ
jgi:hypothetical protein